jgi:hypothetical protein
VIRIAASGWLLIVVVVHVIIVVIVMTAVCTTGPPATGRGIAADVVAVIVENGVTGISRMSSIRGHLCHHFGCDPLPDG